MAKKKALGKGLSALIGGIDVEKDMGRPSLGGESGLPAGLLKLPLSKISPSRLQPRRNFDREKLQELAQSLKSVGVIEPIIVSRKGKSSYELIAGERRWRAAKLAGFKELPAVIKSDADEKVLEMILIENIQREDLSPIEEASGYELLIKKRKITHEKLAHLVGKNRTYITNLLRILALPRAVRDQVDSGKISAGHAKVLAGLKESHMLSLAKEIIKRQLSVRETEKLARTDVSRETSAKKKTAGRTDPNVSAVEEKLRDLLKTKVTVKRISGKVGKVIIEYYDYSGLDDIIRKIKK